MDMQDDLLMATEPSHLASNLPPGSRILCAPPVFLSALFVTIFINAIGCGGQRASRDFRVKVDSIRSSAAEKLGAGDYERRMMHGGTPRYYQLHVPRSYDPARPTPVVLVFHGGGGDPGAIRYESRMDATSDRGGFIVVYPAGTPSRRWITNRLLVWNDGRPRADGTPSKVDDTGFVAALLIDLENLFHVDDRRIYACGFSNGAQFTYRLSKRLTNRIAAIAVVAGQRPPNDKYDPPPSRPIPVMQFAGVKDRVAPYAGGATPSKAGIRGHAPPVRETIRSWVDFNQCAPQPAEVVRVGKAVMQRFQPSAASCEVILWTLEDGGHTWPGGRVVPGVELIGLGKMGRVNQDINASDLMWEFFKEHALKKDH